MRRVCFVESRFSVDQKVNKGKISLSTRIEVELSLGRCFYMGGKANGHFGPLIKDSSGVECVLL